MFNTYNINNCLDCSNHQILNDPDPYDDKCKNEKAVVCTITINNRMDLLSLFVTDKQPYKHITSSCKLENLKYESTIPYWCPINRCIKNE